MWKRCKRITFSRFDVQATCSSIVEHCNLQKSDVTTLPLPLFKSTLRRNKSAYPGPFLPVQFYNNLLRREGLCWRSHSFTLYPIMRKLWLRNKSYGHGNYLPFLGVSKLSSRLFLSFLEGLLLQEWRPFEAVRLGSVMSKVQLVTKLLPGGFHQYKFRSRLYTASLLCRNHSMARCRALTTWVGLITSRLNHHFRAVKGPMCFMSNAWSQNDQILWFSSGPNFSKFLQKQWPGPYIILRQLNNRKLCTTSLCHLFQFPWPFSSSHPMQ